MNRRRIMAILFVYLLFSGIQQTALASSVKPDANGRYHPTIYIDGEKQDLNGTITASGSTMVPFRVFFTALNVEPQFDNNTKTLTAKSGNTVITLTAGSHTATVNGKDVHLVQTPGIENDILYVNLRFIAESFGGIVYFDYDTLTINIDFPKEG